MLQLIAPDGSAVGDVEVGLSEEELRELLRMMIRSRRLDRECMALQRQGELTVYPPFEGQEAAQVGSASALEPDDFVFPSFRELAAAVVRDVDVVEYLEYHRGTWHGGPYDPIANRFAPICVPVATQIVHAVGWALGAKLDRSGACAITYFGDGSASEGDFHEGANLAAVFEAPVILFCQNNGWAISVPLAEQTKSAIASRAAGYGIPGVRIDGNDVLAAYAATREALERARAGSGPTLVEAVTYRIGPHSTADDVTRYRSADDLEPWRARDPIERYRRFLEGRGLIDDTAVKEIEEDAEGWVAEIRTRLVALGTPQDEEMFDHVFASPTDTFIRERDRWFEDGGPGMRSRSEAERNASPGREAAGGSQPVGEEISMVAALNRALADALDADPRTLVFGEDIGPLGGVFRVTEGLQERFGRERVFDTPIAEAGIAGICVGLTLAGWRPIAEFQFDGFSYPALDQVISHIAKYRMRTRGRVELPVTIRIPSFGGIRGKEHHGESPETYYVHTAGLKVCSPSSALDAYALLRSAIEEPDPVIVLEPKARYWSKEVGELAPDMSSVGRARVLREGSACALISYGAMVARCLEAADRLGAEGTSCAVLDLRWLSPLDLDAIREVGVATGHVVVVHEAPRTLGMGAEIVARVVELAFDHLEAPVVRVTAPDVPYPPASLEQRYLPSVDRIVEAARATVRY
ncbi:MAG TPA: pyruvate dehydrogenase (acetyl-transferring) E1 component subunit alpha [Actinomycetota bacterium]|nr:pyruvate dehydrogenase (acetyl-transferring) E1 component subunit alpha [Actinomycetota bacterium]